MAKRRMFSLDVIDSDAFLDMPASAQALYFHLGMRADDEGALNNAKTIVRIVGAAEDDMKLLIAKGFLLVVGDSLVVVKHWKINNYIRSDRFTPSRYREEMSCLYTKDNGAYTLEEPQNSNVPRLGIPDDNQVVYQMDTQSSLVTSSLGQVSIGKDSIVKSSQECLVDRLTDEEWTRLDLMLGDAILKVIDRVNEKVQRPETIRNPYNYIKSVAREMGYVD